MKDIGVYVHIPFCERKCKYCDFFSVVPDDSVKEIYVDELVSEIKKTAGRHLDKRVRTIYIGGGTPSVLKSAQVERILDALRTYFCCAADEITIEVNPNSSRHLSDYAKMGINRVSVGVQSTDNDILKKLGRLHTGAEALDCLERANKFFKNVSADLIIGVEKDYEVNKDLELIVPLITHLSTYMLKLEKNTPLRLAVQKKETTVADEDETVRQYEEAYDYAEKHGLYRYEVSNFARLGYEARHNSSYWKMVDYLGFGPSAHSYADGERYFNLSDLSGYLNGEHSGNGGQVNERPFSERDEKIEFLMLGLRTTDGLDVAEYNRRFKSDFFKEYAAGLRQLKDFLHIRRGRVSIRPQFLLVQNSIIFEMV